MIGINTLVVRSSGSGAVAEGLGFAIPANTAQVVAEQIIQKGYFSRPYLGVQWQAINPNIAARYDLPANGGSTSPTWPPAAPPSRRASSAATSSSHRRHTLDETTRILNVLYSYQPGDQITLTVMRHRRGNLNRHASAKPRSNNRFIFAVPIS